MVNTFGFRPGGPYGMLAPFGFGPPGLQGPAASAGGNGQDGDFADVIPVGGFRGRSKAAPENCQNRWCGGFTAQTHRPLCQFCAKRLENGEPITLESGVVLRDPITPGEEPFDWMGKRFRPPRRDDD